MEIFRLPKLVSLLALKRTVVDCHQLSIGPTNKGIGEVREGTHRTNTIDPISLVFRLVSFLTRRRLPILGYEYIHTEHPASEMRYQHAVTLGA